MSPVTNTPARGDETMDNDHSKSITAKLAKARAWRTAPKPQICPSPLPPFHEPGDPATLRTPRKHAASRLSAQPLVRGLPPHPTGAWQSRVLYRRRTTRQNHPVYCTTRVIVRPSQLPAPTLYDSYPYPNGKNGSGPAEPTRRTEGETRRRPPQTSGKDKERKQNKRRGENKH